MKVSQKYALEHFDELAAVVDGGGVVEIDRPDKQVLHLVRPAVVKVVEQTGPHVLGVGKSDMSFLIENWDEIDREWRKSFAEKFGSDEA